MAESKASVNVTLSFENILFIRGYAEQQGFEFAGRPNLSKGLDKIVTEFQRMEARREREQPFPTAC